jgi:lysozyme family protein
MPTNLPSLIVANANRWNAAKLTRDFTEVSERLVAAKERYDEITALTKVPWFIIAVIHEREADQDWTANLAQGDPWNRVSVHVPKGRGPFKSFAAAARDALVNCHPYAAKWKDWSAGGALTLLEQYNGLGYANRGLPSPYVWSGTDRYKKGKYVSDGVFDPSVVDRQLGCAGLIKTMQGIDPSITFTEAAPHE